MDETEITARNVIAGNEYTQSQVRRISSFLFHVNTILDNKCSQEFSHFHMSSPHAQSMINFSTKFSSQIQCMTSAFCHNVNDIVAILGYWTA